MMGPNGLAVGIDHIPELRTMAEENIRHDHPELLRDGRVDLVGKIRSTFGQLAFFSHFTRCLTSKFEINIVFIRLRLNSYMHMSLFIFFLLYFSSCN